VTSSTHPQTLPPARPGLGRGLLTGLITACVALGVGQLVAGFTSPQASPVVAVGSTAIDLTPPPLKNFAISEFGANDKTALVAGILVLLAVFAAAIGVAAMRRLSYGLVGLAAFTGVGLAAALSRPTAGAGYALPVLVGGAAAVVAMVLLVRAAHAGAVAAGSPGRPAVEPAPRAGPDDSAPAGPGDSAPAPEPGASWVPAQDAGDANGRLARAGARPGGPPATATDSDRRQFLAISSVALAVAGVSALAGRSLAERTSVSQARATLRLPRPAAVAAPLPAGASLHVPGISPFVTPNGSFYRVDTAIILPQVAPESWQLRIHGMVAKEITLSFHDLLRLPLVEDWITLCCVSNPVGGPYIGNAKWLGAKIAPLLRAAGIRAGAEQLICTSADGFTSGTPVQTVMDGRDALLAVAMNDQPLPVAHGFPARLVVPGLYGYVSACKWITDIKVTTFAGEYAYWAQRGWSQQAPIKTESRIDVPSLANTNLRAGTRQIAGVAWAQHKGIDAVEVRVDGGPWQQARLGAVPGIDTWRQWVLDWDATTGNHTIEARATDATGYTQTAAQAPPEPNGATGYPAITVTVQ
jgi:DMSO/TMAO reductase YedYZ molybdopterin-dependent catalytic subunit